MTNHDRGFSQYIHACFTILILSIMLIASLAISPIQRVQADPNQPPQIVDYQYTFTAVWGWGVSDGTTEAYQVCTGPSCQGGIFGTGDGQFHNPETLAVDSSGSYLYVSDTGNHRIQQFDSSGNFVSAWGNQGTAEGQFEFPEGIAVDPVDGSVYVVDSVNNRIQKFTSDGAFIAAWGWGVSDGSSAYQICTSSCQAGTSGANAGQLSNPYAITVGESDQSVYVTDQNNNRIEKFASDGSFLAAWGWGVSDGTSAFQVCTTGCQAGISGSGEGQFHNPYGIVVDSTGNVYLGDGSNRRVQEFDQDGNFQRTWGWGVQDGAGQFEVCTTGCQAGSFGTGNGQFEWTYGLALDGIGNVYVVDPTATRVQRFDSEGNYIDRWGSSGSSSSQLTSPQGLAVDPSGNLYVADTNNHRIEKASAFTPLSSTAVTMDEDGSPTPFSLTMHALDPNSDSLTWSISGPATDGTANVSGTGYNKSIGYTPDANYNGSDSFIVQVSDGTATSTATVNVTINAINDAPSITETGPVAVTMSEDGAPTPFSLTLNATDPENDTLTWSISSAATNGTATASGTGSSKAIGYTPNSNYNGSDSFDVQVSDGSLTDTVTVNVTIEAVDDAPVITETDPVSVTMSEDGTPTPFGLTLHATDVESDTLTWSISSQATNGTATASGTGTSKDISYTPDTGYNGSDSFIVAVSDGAKNDTITVDVTITAALSPEFVDYQYNFEAAWGWGVDDGSDTFQICTSLECQAGQSGSGNGQFSYPDGIAVDGSGSFVYVLDTQNQRVQKLASDGTFVTSWGAEGHAEGQFEYPEGIAVDPRDGSVYVDDSSNNRIQKFDSDGNFIATWGWGVSDGDAAFEVCTSGCQVGIYGSGAGQLAYAYGISVDPNDGSVYVVEYDDNRIQKFTSDGSFIAAWGWGISDGTSAFQVCTSGCQSGISGGGAGQFNYPYGVAVDGNGDVYVSDGSNRRIQKFDQDGNFLFTYGWGVQDGASQFEICTNGCQSGDYGNGEGQFIWAYDLVVDSTGNVYVIDYNNDRVQRFDSAGNYIDMWGSSGSASGQFDGPSSLAIDPGGHLYITDEHQQRVEKVSAFTSLSTTSVSMSEDNSPTPFALNLDAIDPAGKALTWSINSQAGHGTASVSGTGNHKDISYTPDVNYNGSDSFVVAVFDGNKTATLTVNVNLNPVNDPPAFASTPVTMAGVNRVYTYLVQASDIDTGDSLTFSSLSLPAWLNLEDHGDGTATLSGTPGNGDVEDNYVSLQVEDGSEATDTQSFSITITTMYYYYFPFIGNNK